MRKTIIALALSLVALAATAAEPIKPGEKRILSQMPSESEIKQMTKTGVLLTFGRKGMMITSASGVVLITWQELAAYRYMAEKLDSGSPM